MLTIAAVRDPTDRVAVEAEVATAQRQRAIAEDHDRIASELHDTVIQQLFAVGLRLQGLPARMADEHAVSVVNQAVDAIDGTIAEIAARSHHWCSSLAS